ncbi:MAG: hypothetical protein VXZ58_04845, partial [Actinomycetota bacterium]|nr:hypothetical protein [Actinomycetota bacterium]
MSNSDELRKIQLLEKRLLGECQGNPQQFGQEMKEKSNEPGGNSHSHSGGTGETHETIRDQSNSLLLTNDIMTAHNGDENLNNQDRSKETNRGSGRSRSGNEGSSASNSRMSSVNVGTGQQVIELDKSDHSGSLSKISPLRPQGTDKDTMKSSTDQGKRKISSNGSSNAVLRDLNSVLKHVAGSEHGPVGVMNGAPTDGVPSPKAQKLGHESENTNGSSSITILENSGSKSGAIGGSVSNRRTIQSYFTQTGGSSSGAGNGTTSAAERDVRSPATLGDGENAMPNAQANVGGGSRKGNRGILGKNIANVTSTSSS